MPELEIDSFVETDSSDNEEKYFKLLSSVSQLDSTQRVKPATRKEASSEASEYSLTKSTTKGRNLVNVKDLADVLGKKPAHASITKKLKKTTSRSKTLSKPLEKPIEEKIKRSIGFENTKKQLARWDAIVTRNSVKDHLSFPLNNNSMKMQGTSEFLKQFQNSSRLEEEMNEILKRNNTKKEEEDKSIFPLTLEEMMQKRKEMAQLRARMSYKEAKAQQQSKIKSKKYHRILKRQKLKQQLNEFEMLQKTDPEAALRKLAELDKSRAQERASLRHRNTGQWAKNLAVRAKYDVESRKVLAEQLKMSREITQKVHLLSSSDEEGDETGLEANDFSKNSSLTTFSNNPWSLNVSPEIKDFISDYKKYWNEKNKETAEKQKNENPLNENITIKECNLNNVSDNKAKSIKDSSCLSHSSNKKNNEKLGKEQKGSAVPIESSQSSNPSINYNSLDENIIKNNYRNNDFGLNFYPTSGTWIVSPVTDELKEGSKTICNINPDNIDDLFDDLNYTLLKKAQKKFKKIKSKIKREEKLSNSKFKEFSIENHSNSEFDLSIKNINTIKRPDMDVELSEQVNNEMILEGNSKNTLPVIEITPAIDPKNFIQVKPKLLNTELPENLTTGDDALDNEEIQKMTIEEAFIDDDVFAEFKELKKKEKESTQANLSSSLPGWGEWGGEGIIPKNNKRKRRFIVHLPPRKDKKRHDIIINENENSKMKSHLVKEVPYPFKSVEAFEANIRNPVGRDWVPESAHRKLIQKQIETKLGTIIEPMDDNEIIRLKQKPNTPYQGKNKVKAK